MTIDEQLLSRVESLRIPLDDSNSPLDWKDWYHYILIDSQTQIRVLVNLNLIGRPERGEIQTTLMVTIPREYLAEQLSHNIPILTFGVAFSQEWQIPMIQRTPFFIQGKQINLNIEGKYCSVAVEDTRSQLSINFRGEAEAEPLLVTEDSPFGSGFIGWGLVPGLQVTGELSVCQQTFNVDHNWFCYHDRNFGRFRWGEDIGWEWFVAFLTDDRGRKFTLVLDKRTNKDHSLAGLAYIFIYEGNQLRKTFLGQRLQINWEWTVLPLQPLRLPGIMASLFTERTIKTPQMLEIVATDDQDNITLDIQFESTTELIIPDNQAKQYSFIEEATGTTQMTLFLQGETIKATGFVYAEYVI